MWLLLLVVPMIFVGSFVIDLKIADGYRTHWIDETLTFGELAKRIVEIKTSEWNELQRRYTGD
jgi:hypothetical protein